MKLQCPKCSTLNAGDSSFCKGCGVEFLMDGTPEEDISFLEDYSKPSRLPLFAVAGLGTAVLAVLLIGFLATPLFSVWGMSRAARNLDADSFIGYIDFPAFRENLKAELKAEMMANLQNNDELKDNPFAGIAAIAAPALVDNIVDGYVSEKGVKKLFDLARKEQLAKGKDAKAAESLEIVKMEKGSYSYGYSGISEFFVETEAPDGRRIRLLFERNWLVWWKLYNLEIRPADAGQKV